MATARQLLKQGHAKLMTEFGEAVELAGGESVQAIVSEDKEDLGAELGVVRRCVLSVLSADVAGKLKECDVLALASGEKVTVQMIEPHTIRGRLRISVKREVF